MDLIEAETASSSVAAWACSGVSASVGFGISVDLDKERKAIMKQWAKRQEQIERVMGATVGMYGDLQGIAGKSIQEIEGLELPGISATSEGSMAPEELL